MNDLRAIFPNASADVLARNGQGVSEPTKAQIRLPRRKGPNKTEAIWMQRAQVEHKGCRVEFEPFTLHLPSGTRYTPDVVVMRNTEIVAVYEVKGAHIHSAASIRAFKEARAHFPWRFVFAQKRGTEWVVSE